MRNKAETPFHEELLAGEAATLGFAKRLATLARPGDVVALFGDLGAGKTAFARGFINALPDPSGAIGKEAVPSPTFTLVQVYERAPAPVWHFDLYRIERPEEVWELGFDEALAEGISLIEWPERLGRLLPESALRLELLAVEGRENQRRVRLSGPDDWRRRWLAAKARTREKETEA